MTPSSDSSHQFDAGRDERAAGRAAVTEEVVTGWDAFAPLYEAHHVRLYRLALLLCNGHPAVAEDAVAETFILIFEAWKQGRVQNFFGYARMTLINFVLGQHRRETVARRYLDGRTGDRRGGHEAADGVVEQSAMLEYLEQLPPRQRAAVVLRFYEDMNFDQISQMLGVSVGTAKSHVSLAVHRLRELMEPAR